MPKGELTQEQRQRILERLADEAAHMVQSDLEYFRSQGIVPTEALIKEITRRRVRLSRARYQAELEQRVSEGKTIPQAIDDSLGLPTQETIEQINDQEPPHREDIRMYNSYRRRNNFRRLYNTVGSSPLILFILGGLTLLLWTAASVLQIQTSEAMVLGLSQVRSIDAFVFWQPIGLILGQYDAVHGTAYAYAWIVEVITLIFGLALGYAVHVLRQANRMLGKWYTIGCLLLIGLNGWADFSASPGDGVVKFLVAFAIGGIVVTGLPVGLALIEKGIAELGSDTEEEY